MGKLAGTPYLSPSTFNSLKNDIVENRVSLSNNLFEAVDFSDMGVVKEPTAHIPTFVIGEKYALKGVSCEGFDMPEKVYELIGIHDQFDGIDINSLIVKQISGSQDKIFTLSKNDCEHIGIEYQSGLQLFPKHLNWRRVKDVVPFDSTNLATTPLSDIDNTVRYILLKINGFKDYSDGYILTPNGKLIKEEQFVKSLQIVSDEPIPYDDDICLKHNTPLDIEFAYPKGMLFNHGNFISSEDTIYVIIELACYILESQEITSIDGMIGVSKKYLEGFNPNEHFTISWNELGAYTVEEYEAEKTRKEKLRQEQIAKAEANRKRKIAEREAQIREFRRKTEESIAKISAIKIPNIPKMPNFNAENGISSLELYSDSVNLYLDSIETSLDNLFNNLTKASNSIGINLEKRIAKNDRNFSILDLIEF